MSILPISVEDIAAHEEEEAKEEKVASTNMKIEIEEVKVPDVVDVVDVEPEQEQESIFEKPVEISKKTGKPKRKLTEKQLENLKKAREKSAAKRSALKGAKAIEKAEKKLKRDLVMEERLKKKQDEEIQIRLAAQMKLDAEKASHWSEDRLISLMEKTLDNYIDKKKKMKPKARESIPHPTPQMPPAQQRQMQHGQQPQQYYQASHKTFRPTGHEHRQTLPPPKAGNTLQTLFGFDGTPQNYDY